MTTADERLIADMLLWRDVAAFVQGDWDAVAADFDAEAFVGYAGRDAGDLPWELKYPSLEDYRDDWLKQSRVMREGCFPDLERQLLEVQRLASIEVRGEHALVHKVFDGALSGAGESRILSWHTYYFLRRGAGSDSWRITGFAGYLGAPHQGRISSPVTSQHSTAGPYSPALRISPGEIVVISGQGPLDTDGRVVGETIEEQTAVTLDNCLAQLKAAGATSADVFKANVYLSDLRDWDAFNAVYVKFFPSVLPVRAAIGVDLLLDMKVEIEMWAAP
mgnify:CR=1 FL=1